MKNNYETINRFLTHYTTLQNVGPDLVLHTAVPAADTTTENKRSTTQYYQYKGLDMKFCQVSIAVTMKFQLHTGSVVIGPVFQAEASPL